MSEPESQEMESAPQSANDTESAFVDTDSSATETSQEQGEQEHDRETQPVDDENPPRLPFVVVGIGASAGGLPAVSDLLTTLPPDTGMAFVLVQHLPPNGESKLVEILAKRTQIPVQHVEEGLPIVADHFYVIRPGYTLTISEGVFRLGPRVDKPMHSRPVDDFFKSLAQEQRQRAVAIIMSGLGSNGSAGAQAIKAVGGLCIAQDPETAEFSSMPRHLIDAGYADYILRPRDMPVVLRDYGGHPYTRTAGKEKAVVARRDQQHLRDILAALRARTRHDFSGYKKPTVLRRIQRRMGLSRLTKLGDYAQLVRQSPTEVVSLADDLLIHVTGFFRDPDAWESLRKGVIVPLIDSRDSDSSVRCWVTACSSGEEAYTLAMLLVEEAERTTKNLDIKIFATDMAKRTLENARAGIYPGGIESEITPERLNRFFQREDSVYRVRQELRERVIFAPQNLLQDPPFSRLDIVSCRNLLIYLEPDVQQRLMRLLHFGLREGGTLFLGTSETTGLDALFQPIDKKARIYRRIGPTRHGEVDFPLPSALASETRHHVPAANIRSAGPRLSISQMTTRALLQTHTPAAVTIDSDYRIVYYHGETDKFLASPRGEPTRDLLTLARPSIRAAIRTALHRAAAQAAPVTVLDGWLETEPGHRIRVAILASPLDQKGAPGYLVVSFQERGEQVDSANTKGEDAASEDTAELQRMRDELQTVIEALQATNEELKASHEEVVSANEELQSTNEELETSREEMQSLNEELSTVNSQLHAKMEEHQATSNDLASLLTSTDIAVMFLDPQFRIRRFTPPAREMFQLIPGDVGRPLSDLAKKFTDPQMLGDAESVLANLVPVDREVQGETTRWFLRRITPYRTMDNRIDGVVIAFIDITPRRRAEEALRASEEQFRRAIADAPVPVIMQAEDGEVLQISRRWTELTGYELAHVPTLDAWLSRAYGEGANAIRKHMHELFQGDRVSLDVDFSIHTRDNGERQWRFSASAPGILPDGRRYIVGMALDITEGEAAVRALRESEQRYRQALEIETVGVIFLTPAGVITDANAAFFRMSGYGPQDIAGNGLSCERITPQEFMPRARKATQELMTTGWTTPYEKRYIRKDGSQWWALFCGTRLQHGECVEFIIDIEERKRTEAALRESEERFRLLVEGARDFAMLMLDRDRRITTWNIGAERTLGFTEAEAVGQDSAIIFTPEDRAAKAHEDEANRALEKGYAIDERWHIRKDGTRFWGSGVLRTLRNEDGSHRGFVKVMRDDTARKQAEEALKTAKASAENANEMKDEFLATLSHELRTPLGAILLWSKMLSGDSDKTQLSDGLNAIRTSAESQKELIEDLLDMSRITTGNLRLKVREVELIEQVRIAVEAIKPTAEAKGVTLTADLAPNVGVVRADPDRLRQVVWNLLTNAVKFTPEGGRVDVVVRRLASAVEIRVTDSGQGISPEFLPHVFERFRQAEASHTRRQGGLGLGLAICKQLVELQGGTISVQSEGPNKGASFIVQIPLPRVRRNQQPKLSASSKGSGSSIADLADYRVLLIEDDPGTRAAVARLLSRSGIGVVEADSAPTAIAAFTAQQPDLIISDIGLPGEDGYVLLRRIRAHETDAELAATPAIALTAFARDSDREMARLAGFQRHISKPVEPDQLLAAVRELVLT